MCDYKNLPRKFQDAKDDLQLSVVTDRAQGGGSIRDGQIEIMVSSKSRIPFIFFS